MDDQERARAVSVTFTADRQIVRERDRLRLLLDINNAVVSHLDLDKLLHVISGSLRKVVPHDISGIGLYDAESGELRAHVLEYPQALPNFARGTVIPLEGTTGGLAFTTGVPVFIDRPDPERFYADYSKKIEATGIKSGGSIPLIAHGRKLGVLGVASMTENAFNQEHIDLLCDVGKQIAIAVDNALNYEKARATERELARKLDELGLLLGVTNTVTSQLDLRGLFKSISDSLRQVIACDAMVLAFLDEAAGTLRIHALDPTSQIIPPFEQDESISIEGTPAGRAIASLKTVIVTSDELAISPSPVVRRVASAGVQSGCIAPLVSHGKTLGALSLVSLKEKAFNQADADLLTQIAGQIAIAVENALNFERARAAEQEMAQQRERLELLLTINNKIGSSLDLKELFIAISGCLRTLLHHDYADLGFYDPETDRIRLFAIDRDERIHFGKEDIWVPIEGSPPGLAIHSRQTVMRERPDYREFPAESMKRATEQGIRSGCTVPLISRDKVLGVLTVASTKESSFTADDAELLTQVGVQIALAVENALNFEAVRSAERQIKHDRDRLSLLLNVNNAVVSHLDLRDLMKAISANIRNVIPNDFTGLALYEEESKQLRAHALDFEPGLDLPGEGTLFPLEGSPSGLAFTSARPVHLKLLDLDRFSSPFLRRFNEQGLKSLCSVPLISHGRTLGVLVMMSRNEDAFSDDDVQLLAEIAKQVAISVENAMAYGELSRIKNKLAEEKLYLEEEINTAYDFEQIVGSSSALKRILKQVETVAPTDSTVLIQGETGTGKELIARAIHRLSARRERTLVKINCAAIPTGLLESELFGHERGAFTGAIAQRIGRFELANKGTLFLDEVGEIPSDLQPKLLRVLQEREFERLGSTRTIGVDVRLIAATNRDLKQMVSERQFRDDLFYRLNVFPITIPPLRDRREDIPLIVHFFASKFARRMNKRIETIPAKSIEYLQSYHWPGNIRELENIIERGVILTSGTDLQIPLDEIKLTKTASMPVESEGSAVDATSLESVERDHILRVLRETDWVVSGPNGAAATLGLKRTTLQARMKKLGITKESRYRKG